MNVKIHYKFILSAFLILFGGQLAPAQTSGNAAAKKENTEKIDNYTIQRLIVFNDKNEILMEKNSFGWMTPALRSNQDESVKEGLNNLASQMGISVDSIKLAGVFTYKFKGLTDHPAHVSFRTHYTAKYRSGALVQPKDKEYKWLPVGEALEKIAMESLKTETAQIIKFPKSVWGGSFLLVFKDGKMESSKMSEELYPLTDQ